MIENGSRHRRCSPFLMLFSAVVCVVVLGGALAAPVIARVSGYAPAAIDLSEVQTWEIADTAHAEGDIRYPQTPPAGGPHDDVWLDCGAYDEPVRDENAVHDLEHGTTWITYDPDLPARDVEALVELLPDSGILSPYDGLNSPVVVSVWGAQLSLDGARDPRLGLFIDEYGDGHTAPEVGVTCEGGSPDPSGGVSQDGPGVAA